MARARKFDYDEAREMREAGVPVAEIAELCGVTHMAIRRATDPRIAERMAARTRAMQSTFCAYCGGPASYNAYMERAHPVPRCRSCQCHHRHIDTLLGHVHKRTGKIRCGTCGRFEPPDLYRWKDGFPCEYRCINCRTGARIDWRLRNRDRDRTSDRERHRRTRSAQS